MTTDFKNIPTNSLTVVFQNRNTTTKRIKSFYNGKIMLNNFACYQLIKGAQLMHFNSSVGISKGYVTLVFMLLDMLTKNTVELEVDYSDLLSLRTFLEVRIAHCERERDDRVMLNNPDSAAGGERLKFNPDTYIGMKLLLLDIRELMLGEIVNESSND